MVSEVKSLISFILCPSIWYIFVNNPCSLEKKVCYAVVEWSALLKSVRCSRLLGFSFISLLIFCLLVLSINDRRVLKSRPVIVDLSIFPSVFYNISFYFIYFEALLLAAYTFRIVYSW